MQKKHTFWDSNYQKIVLAVLVSMIWITTLTPTVLAINTKINVTFDPDGTVTIDVWPNSYPFGVVYAGEAKLTATTYFTVWNNGTSGMKIQLQTNATSNPPGSGMTYNPVASPGNNEFSLNTTSFTSSAGNYIPINVYSIDYHTLAATSNKQFGLRIVIGSTLSTNYTTQTMEIRFNGVSV